MTRHQRIAAEIIHTTRQPVLNGPGKPTLNYMDVGHKDYIFVKDPKLRKRNPILWVWVDGRVRSQETESWDKDHIDLFPEDIPEDRMEYYQGRFEPETGRLSVTVPERYQHREVPSKLINELERKFNPTKIYVF